MANAKAVNTAIDAELDELDAFLTEADNVEETKEPIDLKVEKADVDLEAIEDDLATADEVEVEQPIETKKATKKAQKKKAPVARFTSTDSLVEFGNKLLAGGDMKLDVAANDDTAQCLARLDEIKVVKVREKLANLLSWAVQGKALSRYTAITMNMVSKAEGPISKADIRNNLLDANVKLSTASSQAGQMTHILTAAQIVNEVNGQFEVNENSTLLGLFETRSQEQGATE